MESQDFEHWKEFCRRMIFNGGLGELTEARKHGLWAEVEPFIEFYKDEPVDGWDGEYCLCDSFQEAFYEPYGSTIIRPYKDECGVEWWPTDDNPRKFFNLLRLVIRAGIDMAVGGEGVLGYTVGDLKKMFDGQIPVWIADQFENLTNQTPNECGIWL